MSDWYLSQLARQDEYGDTPPANWPIMDRDPFEAAALRTRQSVQPEGGRKEGLATEIIVQPGNDIAKAVGNLATLPERAGGAAQQYTETGQYNPAPIMEAASTGMTGGMPMAVKGAAGIFGGRLAQTADKAALSRAEQMAAKGASREQIWSDTGWFQGPDKKWRFEMPDNLAHMKGTGTPSQLAGRVSDPKLGDVFYHPSVYEAYPKARDIPFAGGNIPASGQYSVPTRRGDPGRITISDQSPSRAASTTLHELQHALQQQEGFATGAGVQQAGGSAYENYLRTAGEVEARNVQRRQHMGPEERRAKPPWQTQDVPNEQQLVLMPQRLRWWQRMSELARQDKYGRNE